VQSVHALSQRRVARLIPVERATLRYTHHRDPQEALRMRLRELAGSGVRYGYRRLTVLLKREGWQVNAKRIYRLYLEEGLIVRTQKRKERAQRQRVPLGQAVRPNQKWSMDFVAQLLPDGRWIRVLTVVDQYTRECLTLFADNVLSGEKVAAALDKIVILRNTPESITVDNGTEFASKAMDLWAYKNGVHRCDDGKDQAVRPYHQATHGDGVPRDAGADPGLWRRPAHGTDVRSDAGQQGTLRAKSGCRLLPRPAAETQPIRGPRPATRHHQGWQYLPQVSAGRVRQSCPRAAWNRLDLTSVGPASGFARRQTVPQSCHHRRRPQVGSTASSHLGHARAIHPVLCSSCLRIQIMLTVAQPRVPMTACRVGPSQGRPKTGSIDFSF
jgi:Integrase core domain/HTH-like domain